MRRTLVLPLATIRGLPWRCRSHFVPKLFREDDMPKSEIGLRTLVRVLLSKRTKVRNPVLGTCHYNPRSGASGRAGLRKFISSRRVPPSMVG